MKWTSVALAMLAATLGFGLVFTSNAAAQRKELRVFISDGIKAAAEALTPQMETATGRRLAPEFNSSKALRDRINAGAQFDVAVLTSDIIDELIRQGKIETSSRAEIAQTGMGIGVRAGAAKPDISSSEALKRALLNAKSITFNPLGASAAHISDMFAKMGITETVKSRLMPDARAGGPQMEVASGKVELVITLLPEIKFFSGVDLVGPLPAEFQNYSKFSAGVSTHARDADAARALVKLLDGPSAAAALRAKGMDPL